jgi:hypothetical protein
MSGSQDAAVGLFWLCIRSLLEVKETVVRLALKSQPAFVRADAPAG